MISCLRKKLIRMLGVSSLVVLFSPAQAVMHSSIEPNLPHLNLDLSKHLLVSLSAKEEPSKFQYYSVKGLIHINPKWFLIGTYSSLGIVDNKNLPTTTIYKDKTNSLFDNNNFKRVSIGFGWQPHANLLTQIQVGEDKIDTSSASKLSLKEEDQERSFAGIETMWLF